LRTFFVHNGLDGALGGGAGGLVVASVAAQLGLDVVLIEKEKQLGGDCLHYGCVPSKALLRAAHVAQTLRGAVDYGFQQTEPVTDMAAVRATVQDAVDTIQEHDSHQRFESIGCEVITGSAHFVDDKTILVGDRSISARRFVIATGSTPWVPPIEGLDKINYITNEDVFQLDELPEKLLVLGAGPVGVEMAQAFARLGSSVCVVEKAERILPGADPDVSAALQQAFSKENIQVICGNGVVKAESGAAQIALTLEDGTRLTGDTLLLAIGRRPVVNDLGLEKAGVKYSAQGIRVNHRMRTSSRYVYACGDVTGLYPLTHVAEQQAGIIIANAIFKIPKRMDYRVIPAVVYTEPECAQVGVLESDIDSRDRSIEVVRFDMSELDRAIAEHRPEGFAKLIVKKDRLIGAHIIGPRAGEVIHELVLAIQHKMKLEKFPVELWVRLEYGI
jgi:pyruvate/2-oxoglutarate dehydrogenase complex dihydrolipoamide dehydrogenase (E3) component